MFGNNNSKGAEHEAEKQGWLSVYTSYKEITQLFSEISVEFENILPKWAEYYARITSLIDKLKKKYATLGEPATSNNLENPWTKFFLELEKTVSIINQLSTEFSNQKHIPTLAKLSSHLIGQLLHLMRAFDRLDLDLTLGLIVPPGIDNMRLSAYNFFMDCVKRLIPKHLYEEYRRIESLVLDPEAFKKLTQVEKDAVLIVAGQINRAFREAHLFLDKVEINLSIKVGELSNEPIIVKNDSSQSLRDFNQKFDLIYNQLMQLAGYSTGHIEAYPYVLSARKNRQDILQQMQGMLSLEEKKRSLFSDINEKGIAILSEEITEVQNGLLKMTDKKQKNQENEKLRILNDLKKKLQSALSFESAIKLVSATLMVTTPGELQNKFKGIYALYHENDEKNLKIKNMCIGLTARIDTLKRRLPDQNIINPQDDNINPIPPNDQVVQQAELIINDILLKLSTTTKSIQDLIKIIFGENKINMNGNYRPGINFDSVESIITNCEQQLNRILDKKVHTNWQNSINTSRNAIGVLKALQTQFVSSPGALTTPEENFRKTMDMTNSGIVEIIKLVQAIQLLKSDPFIGKLTSMLGLKYIFLRQDNQENQPKKSLQTKCIDFLSDQIGKEVIAKLTSQLEEFNKKYTNLDTFAGLSLIEKNLLLLSMRAINDLLKQLFVALDKFEIQLFIKEGYLASLSLQLFGNQSLEKLYKNFNGIYSQCMESAGYQWDENEVNRALLNNRKFLKMELDKKVAGIQQNQPLVASDALQLECLNERIKELTHDYPGIGAASDIPPFNMDVIIKSGNDLIAKLTKSDHQESENQSGDTFLEGLDSFIKSSKNFFTDYFDPKIYELCFNGLVNAETKGPVTLHIANSLSALEKMAAKLKTIQAQGEVNNLQKIKAIGDVIDLQQIKATSPEDYATQLGILIGDTYEQANHLKTSLKRQFDSIRPFFSTDALKQVFSDAIKPATEKMNNEKEKDAFISLIDSKDLAQSAEDSKDKLKKLVNVLNQDIQDDTLKQRVNKLVGYFLDLLSAWQAESSDRIHPLSNLKTMEFVVNHFKEVWDLSRGFPQAQSTLWNNAGIEILKLAQLLNLYFRDIYVFLDNIEVDLGLKEGKLKELEISNGLSIEKVIKLFYDQLSDYYFNPDEQYPYFQSIINQRTMIYNQAIAEKHPDAICDFIRSKITAATTEINNNSMAAVAVNKKEKEILKQKMLLAMEGNNNELLGELKKANGDQLHEKLDTLGQDKNNRLQMYRLYQGKIWQALKPYKNSGATKDDLVLQIDGKLNQLIEKRTEKYYFFSASRKVQHEEHIQALIALRILLKQSGYTVADAKKTNALDKLYASHSGFNQILLQKEQKLLEQIQEIDDAILPSVRGKKVIDFLHPMQPVAAKELNSIDKHHQKLIEDRIGQLNMELKTNWLQSTKNCKIQLLTELKTNLMKHQTLDESLNIIRKEHKDKFYLLLEGRTGRMIQQIQHTNPDPQDIIRRIDIEIARLRQQRGKKITFFAASRVAITEICIQALLQLKEHMKTKSFDEALICLSTNNNELYSVLCLHESALIANLALRTCQIQNISKESADRRNAV